MLNDEQIEAVIGKYSTIIKDQGGEVKAAGKWDKRRLAYEIKGRREGIYILMFFDGEPAVAKELDRVFRIADDVIRHIITRVEPEHVDVTRIEHPQPTAEPVAPATPAEEVAEVEEAPAATEEAMEAPAEEAQETLEPAAEANEEPAPEAAEEPAVEEATEAPIEEPVEAAEEPEAQENMEETQSGEAKAQE